MKQKNLQQNKKKDQDNSFILMAGIVMCCIFIFVVGIIGRGKGIFNSKNNAQYKLYIDISSNNNLIFNKYDISVFLDGKEIGSVANGEKFTYLAEVNQGNHEIVFCKSDDSKPKNSKRISVSGDMTFACDLSHDGFSIKLKNEKLTDNIEGSSLTVIDVTGMALPDAKAQLSSIGFINLKEEPYSDIWDADNWIVKDQNIDAGSVVDKNTFIQLNCVKGDEFFSDLYSGKTINEIQQIAKSTWFKLEFEDKEYHTLDISALNEYARNTWVAKHATYDGKSKIVSVCIDNTSSVEKNTSISTPKPTIAPATNKSTITPTTESTSISEDNNSSVVPSQTTSAEPTESINVVKTLVSKTTTHYKEDGTVSGGEYYEYDYKGNIKRHAHRSSYGINISEMCYEYDSKGNITKESYIDSDGTIKWWAKYEYDEKGNEIAWEKQFSSGRDRIRNKSYTLEYDDNGRLIKKSEKGKYGPSSWKEYEYDKNGNIIRISEYSSNSTLLSVAIYEYDKSGKMISEAYYSENNHFELAYKYEYDKSDKIIKKMNLDENGKAVSWEEYEYDENGNEIKCSYSNGGWSETVYDYR